MSGSALNTREAGRSGERAPTPQRRAAPDRLSAFLFTPISPATLGIFRIAFGLLMGWHVWRYMPYVTETLVSSKFFLTYDGFHWVRILPQPAMVALFWVMLATAALVAIGAFYRMAATVLCVSWTYTLLLCQGHYNNHSYLFALIAFLMIFTDATRWFSVDRARGVADAQPGTIPYWQVFVLRMQIVFVYFYAGVAKLGSDWLHGYPMKIWLQQKADFPIVGPFLTTDAAAYLFSYAGLLFDLTIGFALLWRPTRRWALIPLLAFHLTNEVVWNIGIFPWFMLVATLLFFDPDWPERALRRLGMRARSRFSSVRAPLAHEPRRPRLVLVCLGVYLLWQALFPLRHFLYGGSPDWTGEGGFFAWRMLTVDRAEAVRLRVAVTGEGTIGYVELDKYFNDVQLAKLNMVPEQYVRFAHFIRDEMRRKGVENIELYVDLQRRLNERPFQPVIDPDLNLASIEYEELAAGDYFVPLDPQSRPGTDPAWIARMSGR